jgi:hypothetical protein
MPERNKPFAVSKEQLSPAMVACKYNVTWKLIVVFRSKSTLRHLPSRKGDWVSLLGRHKVSTGRTVVVIADGQWNGDSRGNHAASYQRMILDPTGKSRECIAFALTAHKVASAHPHTLLSGWRGRLGSPQTVDALLSHGGQLINASLEASDLKSALLICGDLGNFFPLLDNRYGSTGQRLTLVTGNLAHQHASALQSHIRDRRCLRCGYRNGLEKHPGTCQHEESCPEGFKFHPYSLDLR